MDTSPNIMVRWELDQYVVYFTSGHVVLKGNIASDVGRWINWRVRFDISSDASKGFFEVYKDQVLVGAYKGITGIAGITNSYFKQGIYTQHGVHAQDTTTLISNLVFSSV